MPRAERDAADDEAHRAAAQPDVEPVQHECALDFLAHAAGHDDNEREPPRIARRAQQPLQRIGLDVVQRGRKASDGQDDRGGDAEDERQQPQADNGFRKGSGAGL